MSSNEITYYLCLVDAKVTNQGLWSAFQAGQLLVVCLFVYHCYSVSYHMTCCNMMQSLHRLEHIQHVTCIIRGSELHGKRLRSQNHGTRHNLIILCRTESDLATLEVWNCKLRV